LLAVAIPFAENLLGGTSDNSASSNQESTQTGQASQVAPISNDIKPNQAQEKPSQTEEKTSEVANEKPAEQQAVIGETGLPKSVSYVFNLSDVPAYSGEAYVALNDNQPLFTEADYTTLSFENYGELDSLKRCTTAYANIAQDLMPTEERGSISSVKPSGWKSAQYDCVDGKHLYNRCHLIGFQLAGENANKLNLITGTRYLNVIGMLPFENLVADYVKDTGNHVLYRVDPIFEGDNLVASGVTMEGWSVEDKGEGICFYIYCYNVQPGVSINYADGSSKLDEVDPADVKTYIINTNNYKFHTEDCASVKKMQDKNKQVFKGTREQLLDQGYLPCTTCNP